MFKYFFIFNKKYEAYFAMLLSHTQELVTVVNNGSHTRLRRTTYITENVCRRATKPLHIYK